MGDVVGNCDGPGVHVGLGLRVGALGDAVGASTGGEVVGLLVGRLDGIGLHDGRGDAVGTSVVPSSPTTVILNGSLAGSAKRSRVWNSMAF